MTATQTPTRKLAESVSVFVIFEIVGGCACCKPGARETVLPAGWAERAGRLSLRQVLARPHGVKVGAIKILASCFAADLTRERVDEMRCVAMSDVRYAAA